MTYYICNYSDYVSLPNKLSSSHTAGHERKNLDETKFVIWCGSDTPTNGSLYWMSGSEPSYTHSEIVAEVTGVDWEVD